MSVALLLLRVSVHAGFRTIPEAYQSEFLSKLVVGVAVQALVAC
jgi:hypothetical protein